jgi:hypothetical protein
LQSEGGKQHEGVPRVYLPELAVVDEPVLVHVELLKRLLEVTRKGRRGVVDTSTTSTRKLKTV